MARTAQLATIGKYQVELSNLKKVLFPEDGIVKAEVVEYYLKIAPTLLQHVKGRPLSLVRFPDGIHGDTFFQKNRPEWAPEWIEYVPIGDEKKTIDYMMATTDASLVWLANLACIEIHQMHVRAPDFEKPDYMVFDVDPPEDFPFAHVVEIALALREHIEAYDYHPFVKTTGKKGVHVVVPIEARWENDRVFEAISDIGKDFVKKRPKDTTLQISKKARVEKALIDIYRNRLGQSIVSAYSLRGLAGAPVSMPLTWDELAMTDSPRAFTLHNALEHVVSEGDAWEAIAAYAVRIHTDRKGSNRKKKTLPASPHHKTPDQLEEYARKRSFTKTPEPTPEVFSSDGDAFVVHRHHASNLHYDLRIEKDGTLKSWAVPRGMPPRPGIKRLAVATEDHPLEYLTFEGEIPKGQYGGGMMWVFAGGRYQVTKQKKDGFYFRLQSLGLNAEYRIYHTRNKEWLLERVDTPQIDWLHEPVEFMHAENRKQPPAKTYDYLYEVKWDGIRAMIALDEGEVRIRSRNNRDITRYFPELQLPEAFRGTCGLFDGEIVCLETSGHPNFRRVVSRLHHTSETRIEQASHKHPANCYLFDCLYLDGRPIINEPVERRREWLIDTVRRDTPYRASEALEDGRALFEAVQQMGIEGIVAKAKGSRYQPGKRTTTWLKIKVRNTTECVILGYTKGRGDRSGIFGALHIAETAEDGALTYRGKVGTGFDTRTMKSVLSDLRKLEEIERPIKEKPVDDAATVWVEPVLICEIQYASLTNNGTFREPVFLRLRPDLQPET